MGRIRVPIDVLTITPQQTGFSQTYTIGNIGIIANCALPYIYRFHPYLYHMTVGNVNLYISG